MMAEYTEKQPNKYVFQIPNSDRVDEEVLRSAAKKFKLYALDMDMTYDQLFLQLVKTLPSRK